MKNDYDAERYEKACDLLPGRLSPMALDIPGDSMAKVEEIRLRVGRPLHLALPGGEIPIQQTRVIREDLEYIIDRATEFSRYTAIEMLRCGFVTAEGGYRIGICGTVLPSGDSSKGIRDISSVAIRIPRVKVDVARPILPRLMRGGDVVSTLIISPPGGGKTTFLRDLVRLISDGSELSEPMRVSLVDERGEIAAVYRGYPQLDVGSQTDVMDACPKALAIPMLLRAMTPQVIAVDEIALQSDVDALCAASNCGVGLLATAHASCVKELAERPVLSQLLEQGIFERVVVVTGTGRQRSYRVEVLE